VVKYALQTSFFFAFLLILVSPRLLSSRYPLSSSPRFVIYSFSSRFFLLSFLLLSSPSLNFLSVWFSLTDKGLIERLNKLVSSPFVRVQYTGNGRYSSLSL
jgi:hypothetical protein